MKGATPEGARSEREAATWVRAMFGRVAPRYDLANHLLSFHIDRWWRARTVRRVTPILERPGARVLDLCCGTGDLVVALQRVCPQPVFGSDFCHPMLLAARAKLTRQTAPSLLFEADALRLPVRDGSLDLVTVAFGFRNLANYAAGLREMRRVLRPGGSLFVLEFSQAWPFIRPFANLHIHRVAPALAGWLTGDRAAYEYLGTSIEAFPGREAVSAEIRAAGFPAVSATPMTMGVVALHAARR